MADEDATVVARLRAAGGSSGGSAAALAAGLSDLEFGSDLAGSIRLPAAACGVHGLRPTPDTVPLTGFRPPGAPPGPTAMSYLSALGPMARSAADPRTALRVTGGPDDASARACTWRLAPARHTRLADFRVGVVLDDPACPVLPGVGDRLSDVADALAAAGVSVVGGRPGRARGRTAGGCADRRARARGRHGHHVRGVARGRGRRVQWPGAAWPRQHKGEGGRAPCFPKGMMSVANHNIGAA